MRLPGYAGDIDPGPLETALYRAIAEDCNATIEEVAAELFGRHRVPSDAFYNAYDNEIAALRDRYLAAVSEREERIREDADHRRRDLADHGKLEQTLGDEITNALAVFVLDRRIRTFLEHFDPKALEQARRALGLIPKKEVADGEAR